MWCVCIIGARPVGGGFFAPGVGSIHMDNVECSGNEEKLLDCFSVEQHNCRHSEDAGVICEGQSCLIYICVLYQSTNINWNLGTCYL